MPAVRAGTYPSLCVQRETKLESGIHHRRHRGTVTARDRRGDLIDRAGQVVAEGLRVQGRVAMLRLGVAPVELDPATAQHLCQGRRHAHRCTSQRR